MRVVNRLTKPGGIRRVDLTPDTVRIQTRDGQDRVYRLIPEYNAGEKVLACLYSLPLLKEQVGSMRRPMKVGGL